MELKTLATYPFLSETAKYVAKNGPNLEELLNDRAYSHARDLGKGRVMEALNEGEVCRHIFEGEVQCLQEILSYVVARMLVSAVDDNFLVRRYGLAEGVRANRLLQEEEMDKAITVLVAFGMDVSPGMADDLVEMPFLEYLCYISKIKEREWKLVNRTVECGNVKLSIEKMARVFQQAVNLKMDNDLPLPVNEAIRTAFKDEISELKHDVTEKKALFEPKDFGEVDKDSLPPCIKKLVGMTQASENVPHSGRFAMVAFLHLIGMSNEEILSIFVTSPDFDDDIAKYQINHITGESSDTEYTPPGCDTMKSYGICYNPDELCEKDWITHPLKYYRRKKRRGRGPGRNKGKGVEDKTQEGRTEKNKKD